MLFCEDPPFKNADHTSVHHVFRGREHVHLCSDTNSLNELVAYAIDIGLSPKWLQTEKLYHFDVTGKFMLAVQNDTRVTKLARRQFVEKMSQAIKLHQRRSLIGITL